MQTNVLIKELTTMTELKIQQEVYEDEVAGLNNLNDVFNAMSKHSSCYIGVNVDKNLREIAEEYNDRAKSKKIEIPEFHKDIELRAKELDKEYKTLGENFQKNYPTEKKEAKNSLILPKSIKIVFSLIVLLILSIPVALIDKGTALFPIIAVIVLFLGSCGYLLFKFDLIKKLRLKKEEELYNLNEFPKIKEEYISSHQEKLSILDKKLEAIKQENITHINFLIPKIDVIKNEIINYEFGYKKPAELLYKIWCLKDYYKKCKSFEEIRAEYLSATKPIYESDTSEDLLRQQAFIQEKNRIKEEMQREQQEYILSQERKMVELSDEQNRLMSEHNRLIEEQNHMAREEQRRQMQEQDRKRAQERYEHNQTMKRCRTCVNFMNCHIKTPNCGSYKPR